MFKQDIHEYAWGLAAEIEDNQIDVDEAIEILIDEYKIPYSTAYTILQGMQDNS
jgi:hypothetical protein